MRNTIANLNQPKLNISIPNSDIIQQSRYESGIKVIEGDDKIHEQAGFKSSSINSDID